MSLLRWKRNARAVGTWDALLRTWSRSALDARRRVAWRQNAARVAPRGGELLGRHQTRVLLENARDEFATWRRRRVPARVELCALFLFGDLIVAVLNGDLGNIYIILGRIGVRVFALKLRLHSHRSLDGVNFSSSSVEY